MKRHPDFTLLHLAGTPYILPTGQALCDRKKGLCTNEAGVFLWDNLTDDITEDELLLRFTEHYSAPAEMTATLRKDMLSFLEMLRNRGMLQGSSSHAPALHIPPKFTNVSTTASATKCYLSIGGLTVAIAGTTELISPAFQTFRLEPESSTQMISANLTLRILTANAEIDITACPPFMTGVDVAIYHTDSGYLLRFPYSKNIRFALLAKDGSEFQIYCEEPTSVDAQTALREDIFHATRLAFLYTAARHGRIAIHSASIGYKEKAWLFSASSQTGKSTHASLWHRYVGTPVLNGDMNLIGFENGKPQVYGTPWCGTSGICTTKTISFGGIAFLKQAPYDKATPLSPAARRLHLINRLLTPVFDSTMLLRCYDVINLLADNGYFGTLECTPTESAVNAIREQFDAFITSPEPLLR